MWSKKIILYMLVCSMTFLLVGCMHTNKEEMARNAAIEYVKSCEDFEGFNIDVEAVKMVDPIDSSKTTWIIDYDANIESTFQVCVGNTETEESIKECYVLLLYNEDVGIYAYQLLNANTHDSPYTLQQE